MEINEYQKKALSFNLPASDNMAYSLSGMSAEVGEINDKIAKWIRKGYLHVTYEWDKSLSEADIAKMLNDLSAEIGDVQWFVSHMSKQIYRNLEEVCNQNISKLEGRASRGTIVGSGDHR